MLILKIVRALNLGGLGLIVLLGASTIAQEGPKPIIPGPGAKDSQGLGTKGTIGYVCYTVKEGKAIQWLANTPKPREFTQCMDEVANRWKTVALTESDESAQFQARIQEWFLESYRSTVGLGETLGCQVKLREEWRRKLLEPSDGETKGASKESSGKKDN